MRLSQQLQDRMLKLKLKLLFSSPCASVRTAKQPIHLVTALTAQLFHTVRGYCPITAMSHTIILV